MDKDSSLIIGEKKFDVCQKGKFPEQVKLHLIGLGIPLKCPIKKTYIQCYNESQKFKLSLGYQKLIPLFASSKNTVVEIRMTHDTGTSCIKTLDAFRKI